MPLIYHVPLLTILLASVSGFILLLFKDYRQSFKVVISILSLSFILTVALSVFLIFQEEPSFKYALGYYPAPWGNEFKVTIIEAFFASLSLLVILVAQLSGKTLLTRDVPTDKLKYYYLMVNILAASLLALTYTNDVFTAYVFLEINTIAASVMMVAKLNGPAVKATIKYFIMSAIGSAIYLLGTANLYGLTGYLSMEDINRSVTQLVANGEYTTGLTITVILLVIGLAVKSGLFPFHGWSPDGYSNAIPANSAILSGVVSKAYILLAIKIIYRTFGLEVLTELGILPIFFVLGLLAMLFGSVMAYYQRDIFKRTAYSSVSQVGYIYVALGLASPLGITAALFHMVHHSLTKAVIFITMGQVSEQTGSRQIRNLNGTGILMPRTLIIFIVAGFSMIGIPPTIGFNAKWYLVESMIASPYIWAVAVLSISTLLSAAYWLPIMIRSFFSERAESYRGEKLNDALAIPMAETWPLILLIVLILLIAFVSRPLFNTFLEHLQFFQAG